MCVTRIYLYDYYIIIQKTHGRKYFVPVTKQQLNYLIKVFALQYARFHVFVFDASLFGTQNKYLTLNIILCQHIPFAFVRIFCPNIDTSYMYKMRIIRCARLRVARINVALHHIISTHIFKRFGPHHRSLVLSHRYFSLYYIRISSVPNLNAFFIFFCDGIDIEEEIPQFFNSR